MTTVKICSHCHMQTLKCQCENFHPEIELPDDLFCMDREEACHLMDFFYSVGYISHEFHMPVHSFIKRLQEFLK